MKPYAWQETAVVRFVKDLFFLLWVDCGCGKTLAGALIALKKRLPTIIIAPGHLLCDQWRKELIEAGVAEEDIWVCDRSEERKKGAAYAEAYEAWIGRDGTKGRKKETNDRSKEQKKDGV